jgi:hypothetical protein
VRQRRNEHVVGLGNRPVNRVIENLAGLEFFKIESWHTSSISCGVDDNCASVVYINTKRRAHRRLQERS